MAAAGDHHPTRLVTVRHGESNVTVNRLIGGVRTCSGLSDLGRRQAERLANRWMETTEIVADLLISSDFPRAIETAEIIQPALGPTVAQTAFEQLSGFGEHDPGPDIDGMSFAAYVERFGTPDWSGDPHVEIFPGGETTFEFHQRVESAFDELLARHAGSCIVIACHGGVIDAVLRKLLTAPMTGGFESYTLNTSITEFVGPTSPGGVWRLVRYNDAAHLVGLPSSTDPQDSDTASGDDPPAASMASPAANAAVAR
jgi:2,3-bisphosphoglycerate-dependent phosphoglycerate mutase